MTWLRNPITLGVVALLAVILLASTIAIVPETKQVVVVRLEQPVGTVNRWKAGETLGQTGAGLIARIPLVDRLIWIDKRVLDLDLDNQPVLSTDQQRLEVDAFAGIDLRLAIQGQVIGILRDQHMSQQPRAGKATIDGS